MDNNLREMLFLDKDNSSNLYGIRWLKGLENRTTESVASLSKEDKETIKNHLSNIIPLMLLGYANGSKKIEDCPLDADYFLKKEYHDDNVEEETHIVELMKYVLLSSILIFSALDDKNLTNFKNAVKSCNEDLEDAIVYREYSVDIFVKKVILKSMLTNIDKHLTNIDDLNAIRFKIYYKNFLDNFHYKSNEFFCNLKNEANSNFNSQHEIDVFTHKYYNSGEPLDTRFGYYRDKRNKFEDMTVSLSYRAESDYLEAVKVVMSKFNDDIENINMDSIEMESIIQIMLMKKDQKVNNNKIKLKKF